MFVVSTSSCDFKKLKVGGGLYNVIFLSEVERLGLDYGYLRRGDAQK